MADWLGLEVTGTFIAGLPAMSDLRQTAVRDFAKVRIRKGRPTRGAGKEIERLTAVVKLWSGA
jgi:hypothetical protein